jgi:hypothetical protein
MGGCNDEFARQPIIAFSRQEYPDYHALLAKLRTARFPSIFGSGKLESGKAKNKMFCSRSKPSQKLTPTDC